MRAVPGVSLLLIGSGIYWILSSHLIGSFTVLLPGLFESTAFGQLLITIIGIISVVAGLWTLNIDVEEFRRLANSPGGFAFVLPIAFASLDLCSTSVGLSPNYRTIELNPFVAAAIQYGFAAVIPFLISYLALSQGLAILMLRVGRRLFGEANPERALPFALICGISSFGPFSNTVGLVAGYVGSAGYILAAIGSAAVTVAIARHFRTAMALRPTVLS